MSFQQGSNQLMLRDVLKERWHEGQKIKVVELFYYPIKMTPKHCFAESLSLLPATHVFSKVQIVLAIPCFSFLKESLPSYKVNFIITLFIVFHLLIPSLLLISTLLFTIFHMDSATFKCHKFRFVSFNGKMLLESNIDEKLRILKIPSGQGSTYIIV